MKLRQLQCLCAIADAGFNISRAAAVLHASQPAVGKQLRQLEEELGVDLLQRRRDRPIGLTEAGERTIAWARRSLQCADNIRTAACDTRAGVTGGEIVLATSHTHANYLLLPAIMACAKAFPQVRIKLRQGTTEQIQQRVQEGQVTVGVTLPPAQPLRDVLAIPFLSARQVLALPAGHPLLRVEKLTLQKIAAWPIIAQDVALPQGARVLRAFREAGVEPTFGVEALDSDVMKTYVAAGLGIALIPEFCYMPQRDRGLRVRDVGHLFDPVSTSVLLKRNSHLPQYVYTFLAHLDPALGPERVASLIFDAH